MRTEHIVSMNIALVYDIICLNIMHMKIRNDIENKNEETFLVKISVAIPSNRGEHTVVWIKLQYMTHFNFTWK
jgi:tRNA splicing ligase